MQCLALSLHEASDKMSKFWPDVAAYLYIPYTQNNAPSAQCFTVIEKFTKKWTYCYTLVTIGVKIIWKAVYRYRGICQDHNISSTMVNVLKILFTMKRKLKIENCTKNIKVKMSIVKLYNLSIRILWKDKPCRRSSGDMVSYAKISIS